MLRDSVSINQEGCIEFLIRTLKENDVNIKDCHGQSYDNGVTMKWKKARQAEPMSFICNMNYIVKLHINAAFQKHIYVCQQQCLVRLAGSEPRTCYTKVLNSLLSKQCPPLLRSLLQPPGGFIRRRWVLWCTIAPSTGFLTIIEIFQCSFFLYILYEIAHWKII